MKERNPALYTKRKIIVHLTMFTAFFALWGCAAFTPEQQSRPAGELPAKFSLYSPAKPAAAPWWTNFENNELNQLIDNAMGQNFSIRQAKARLDQAQAVSMASGAQRLPQLEYEAGASTSRTKTEAGGQTSEQEYTLGLAASYEIDLWGRVRSQQQAAFLDQAAVKEDLFTAGMTVAGEVAQVWINIIEKKMELEVLFSQLETNQILQDLVDLRFRKGMVSALDVYQQKQSVASVKASIPLVELEKTELKHQLAQLIGYTTQAQLNIETEKLPSVKDLPSVGIPADLLANRPDVRAAGLKLQSADWSIAVAKADRLPSLHLTAQAAYFGGTVKTLFDNWLLNLLGSLTGPVFDGNSRKAEVLRTQAVAKELVAAYGEVVFNAIKEVEDALAQEEKHRQYLAALEQQLEVSQNAMREAKERYIRGLNDYLPVLTQVISVQQLERDILQMNSQLILDRINLYRALGGSWTNEIFSSENSLRRPN